MVLLVFFLFLFCIVLPLGEVSRITLGLNVSFTFVDITVLVGSMIWLIRHLLQKYSLSLQAKGFVFITGVFVLSLLCNLTTLSESQFLIAGLYILRFVSLTTLFFLIKNSSKNIKQSVSRFLLIGGSILVASGYIQYFFYPSLRNLIYFGWDEHFYRMFGTFFDPNFFGLFLVLFFLFVLSKLFTISPEKKKYLFVFFLALSVATFIGIFLSYSRTALIALSVGVIILFWNKKIWKLFAILFTIAALSGILFFISRSTRLGMNTLEMNSLFRATSTSARLGSARDALIIFQDNPLIGVGFNAYRYAMYRHHFQPGTSIQEDHGASGADSSVLLVLATSGIVGLAAYVLFLGGFYFPLLRKRNKLGLATLSALFVGSFFVNGLFYPFLLVWVWGVLGTTTGDEQ